MKTNQNGSKSNMVLQLLQNKWVEHPHQQLINNSAPINLPPFIQQLFADRHLSDLRQLTTYLNPTTDYLYNPYHLPNMDKAVAIIKNAIATNQKILIYGDYDVDGITATVIMYETLLGMGAQNLLYYLPSRLIDGYGPNLTRYKEFIKQGVQLIVTVDNGVGASEPIRYAREHNVDVVITDHHEYNEDDIPPANAIVHPTLPQSEYPFTGLCGAGVAFKVAAALLYRQPTQLLDLVTLGTIADVMPMIGENHIIVSKGLDAIRDTNRPGLKALLKMVNIDMNYLSSTDLSFSVIPILNATGRIKSANLGFKLLTTHSQTEAEQLANQIMLYNNIRKSLQQQYTKSALQQIKSQVTSNVIVGDGWHPGIAGIVAANVVEATNKPAIVLAKNNTTKLATGSARSTDGIDYLTSIQPYKSLTNTLGGHAQAFGLSVKLDQLSNFISAVEHANLNVDSKATKAKYYDASIDLANVTLDLYQNIMLLGPFGQSNGLPIFKFENFVIDQISAIGDHNDTIRITLNDINGRKISAIGFNFNDEEVKTIMTHQNDHALTLIGTVSTNTFNHHTNVQIMIKDLGFIQ